MRVSSYLYVCAATMLVGGTVVSACSSGSSSPGNPGFSSSSSSGGGSTTSSSSSSSSSGSGGGNSSSSSSSGSGNSSSSGSSSSSSGSGGGSSSSSSGSTPPSSSSSSSSSGGGSSSSSSSGAVVEGGLQACPAGLQDKVTSCDATSVSCNKGCGPDTTTAGVLLGEKACVCDMTLVPPAYHCGACEYPQPLPACYLPPLDAGVPDPPACAAGIADKGACTVACGGVCAQASDAGKLTGCVCIQLPTSLQWSCQTDWWGGP